jgi:hypothetical protein
VEAGVSLGRNGCGSGKTHRLGRYEEGMSGKVVHTSLHTSLIAYETFLNENVRQRNE